MSEYGKTAEAKDRIRQALKLRNMKQVDLAERSRISKQSINCYVTGKYEPKQEALYRMGKALDVSEMWLAGYDIPMDRPVEQKENDLLSDIVDRMTTDKEFRQLIIQLYYLNNEQLKIMRQLTGQLKG